MIWVFFLFLLVSFNNVHENVFCLAPFQCSLFEGSRKQTLIIFFFSRRNSNPLLMMLTFFLSPFCISTPCTLSTNLNEMSNSRDSHESLTSLESSSSLASSRVSPAHVDAPIPLQDINQRNAGEEGGGGEQQNDDENNDIANAYFPDGDERNLINSILDEKIEAKPTLWRKVLDVIWPNYILNHLDYASFKIVCRSWCHVWSCAVLTIIPRTY